MKIKFAIFGVGALLPAICFSLPITIFDAERDCASRVTSTGIRYVPECNFQEVDVLPDQSFSLSVGSDFRSGLFKSNMEYSFKCNSLRPLSISFDIRDGQSVIETGNVSGAATTQLLNNTMTHSFDSVLFTATDLVGATGFQAIKPDCEMSISQFISYPEPTYFSKVIESKISVDGLITTLLSIAQPDADYISTLSAIQNGKILLSFLSEQSDEITQLQIQLTIARLDEAQDVLSQQCGVDSSSLLCTSAIANTRNVLINEASMNVATLVELKEFLELEVIFLQDTGASVAADLIALQAALENVSQYLSPE